MNKDPNYIPYSVGPLAGMTNHQIFQQSEKDTEKQINIPDPIEEGEKLYGNKNEMFKRSMNDLKRMLGND